MRYFMHNKELSPKLEKRIKDYFTDGLIFFTE